MAWSKKRLAKFRSTRKANQTLRELQLQKTPDPTPQGQAAETLPHRARSITNIHTPGGIYITIEEF